MHAKIEGTEPVDLLAGPLSLPIVSGRFRDHLQDFRLPEIEFKPITFAPDYYLLNFFTSYDCIDLENSPGWTRDEDGLTPAGTTMAVSASKIPSNADIFRMDGVSDCILFREPVAMSLKGKGFKGVAFIRRACIGIELCRNEE